LTARGIDHWVCEHWAADDERWVMVDIQLCEIRQERERFDAATRAMLPDLNPFDIPAGQFLTGGQAWQRCRMGQDDPNRFGIADMWGLWFIRDDLLRDLLALNKIEVLPWDGWGMIAGKMHESTPDELALLDHIAVITQAGDAAFAEVRALYEQTPGLHLPPEYVLRAAWAAAAGL
jgi:hypothetical protein